MPTRSLSRHYLLDYCGDSVQSSLLTMTSVAPSQSHVKEAILAEVGTRVVPDVWTGAPSLVPVHSILKSLDENLAKASLVARGDLLLGETWVALSLGMDKTDKAFRGLRDLRLLRRFVNAAAEALNEEDWMGPSGSYPRTVPSEITGDCSAWSTTVLAQNLDLMVHYASHMENMVENLKRVDVAEEDDTGTHAAGRSYADGLAMLSVVSCGAVRGNLHLLIGIIRTLVRIQFNSRIYQVSHG